MYREVLRKMKLNWIGHNLAPPLLLTFHSEEVIDEEKERRDWEHVEKVVGYVGKSDSTRIVAFNAKEEHNKHQQEGTSS
jgi:hypothetical protein